MPSPAHGGTTATVPSASAAEPGSGRLSSRRNIGLAILALAMGGFGIGTTEFAMMGLLADIADGLQISISESGHLISAYAVGVVVGAPLLAALGAKWPRRKLALGLMMFFTAANVSSYFAADYGWMLLTRFASGLPHGAYFGIAAVTAASLVAPTKRGRAVAAVMLGLSVANVIGVPFATWLGQQFGWRLLFLFVGLIGAGTLAMIWRCVPYQGAAADASISREMGALRRTQVWLTLLIGVVGFGGFFAVYTYISPTMTELSGLPAASLPLIVALYGVGMVAGNLIGGRIADISVMGSIYGCMITIALVLTAFSLLAPYAWAAVVLVFLVGASGSMLIPALQTRLMDAAADAQSLAASLSHSALNVANALGAFLGGLVIAWGWGLQAPALVGAVLAVLGLFIAAASGRLDVLNKRRRAASSPSEDPIPAK